ncbi:MAG: hypothetical protein M3447_06190 [Acidobacteriota bacterium]|nr:hypothetical protein [Acidobacteriota bacterium]
MDKFHWHKHSTSLAHDPPKLDAIQWRRGEKRLSVNVKRRHNARIDRARIQRIKHSSSRMKDSLTRASVE